MIKTRFYCDRIGFLYKYRTLNYFGGQIKKNLNQMRYGFIIGSLLLNRHYVVDIIVNYSS